MMSTSKIETEYRGLKHDFRDEREKRFMRTALGTGACKNPNSFGKFTMVNGFSDV